MAKKFSNRELAAFSGAHEREAIRRIEKNLSAEFPEKVSHYKRENLRESLESCVSRMKARGIVKASNLQVLCAWDIHYGPNFESRDPDASLSDILSNVVSEDRCMALVRDRLNVLYDAGALDGDR